MNIQLSEHFDYRKLLRFTMPSVIMMVFTSIYGVVDGVFVSNFAGKTAFAAINLIIPYRGCGAGRAGSYWFLCGEIPQTVPLRLI